MPVYNRLKGIGAIAMCSALVLGCSHFHRKCACNPCGTPLGTADSAALMPNSQVVASEPLKPNDQPTAAAPEPKSDTILVNAVETNGTTGTVAIPTAQAEKMGIRPGYTPGAIYPSPPAADQITPRQGEDPRGTSKGEGQ
jgi:hypothetical protein